MDNRTIMQLWEGLVNRPHIVRACGGEVTDFDGEFALKFWFPNDIQLRIDQFRGMMM